MYIALHLHVHKCTKETRENIKNHDYIILLYSKQFLGQMVRSHWLIFDRDFYSTDHYHGNGPFVYFFPLLGNSKPHEAQKVKTNALKSLVKAKYSFKKLLFLSLSFIDKLEDDEEFEHSSSEFYYPEEDFNETSIEASHISESQEKIEGFINKQKSANTTKKTTTDMNTLSRYKKTIGMSENVESLP